MNSPPPHPPAAPGDGSSALRDRLLARDPEAVDAWFRAEHPCVYRLCFGFLADAEAAEELAQDALLHLLDHLHQWNAERSWESWRNTVVLNRCRDRQRRDEARGRAHEAAARLRLESERDVLPDPAREAERSEVRATLNAALASLTPREREAFVLRDLEQRDTSEVAATMGVTPASVRSLLTLARRRLRTLLGERLLGSTGGTA